MKQRRYNYQPTKAMQCEWQLKSPITESWLLKRASEKLHRISKKIQGRLEPFEMIRPSSFSQGKVDDVNNGKLTIHEATKSILLNELQYEETSHD